MGVPILSAQVQPITFVDQMNDITSEPSGLAFIYNTSNGHFEYWVNNDYNYPDEIFSVQLDDVSTITRTLTVNQSYIDWEDMTQDDNNNIYLGDFGNWVGQNDLQIVKIPDPNSYAGSPPSVEVIEYIYPFVGISDMEAMIHYDGFLYLFTKAVNPNNNPQLNDSYTYLFRIPDSPNAGGTPHTAVLIDSLEVIGPGEDPTHFRVTGADLSPDKRNLALLTYERIWVFSCFENDDFFSGTMENFLIPYRQYEGITFINNHEVVVSKEGSPLNPNYNPHMYYMNLYPWMDDACIDCEKLINGNFTNSNLAWTKFLYGNGAATLDMTNGMAEIDIQTIGTSQWHVNIRHKSLVLENGKTYEISYKAHAEDDRPVSVIANKKDGSLGYAYFSQMISTIPTVYTHQFTMNESTDYNAYFSLNVGNYFAHKVYFDDISLVEVDCICPVDRTFTADMNTVEEHYECSNTIYATSLINGTNITFDAANCVEMDIGFEVKAGAEFEAYNDGCGGN